MRVGRRLIFCISDLIQGGIADDLKRNSVCSVRVNNPLNFFLKKNIFLKKGTVHSVLQAHMTMAQLGGAGSRALTG